jgi:hypothetical protein
MKIKREFLGSTIKTKKGTYVIEDTPEFYRAARLHGFDHVLVKERKKKKVEPKAEDNDSSDESSE